jgi:hypothetical protein
MKQHYRNFLLLILLCLPGLKVSATHMAGADLTYQYLGNDQYLVTYTFYRDCIGIDAPTEAFLDYGSASCGITSSATLLPVPGTGQQINYTCPGAVTTCDGGNDPGIQEWEYTGIITISAQCPDWTFGVSQCCRNAAITTIDNPLSENLYVEASLNNMQGNNSSPVFSNVPIAFECIGQDNYYNHGGLDVDGDSLVYSFFFPLNAPNDPLTYLPGYSIANPITSTPAVSINPFTGDIFMHPTQPEVGVLAVRIEEYRNGVLIGAVVRDIQIYVVQCNNQLPVASGLNCTNVFNHTACVGGQLCFDICSTDPDPNDSVTVLWNQGIPGATFTVNQAQFPTGHFCWTPTPADVRSQPYFFTVTVHDNACPSNGVQTFSYYIIVSNLQVTLNVNDIACAGGHNGSASVSTTGTGNVQYLWMPGEFTTPTITHLTAGNYSVDVMDSLGCSGVYYFTVNEPAPMTLNLTSQNPSCSGAQGNASVTASGGTAPYSYEWSTNDTTQTITGLNAGTYTVTVTDDNNCSSTGSVTLTGSAPFTASMSTTPATCNNNDGTATVAISGSSGPFDYDWQPNVSTTDNATQLTAGVYTVTVTDLATGCLQTVSGIVNNSAGIVASIVSSTDATCQNGEDGTATAMGSGGTAPYSYLWTPGGDTNATATNLAPGTYVVAVADYNGCTGFANVTIGYTNAAPVVDLGPDTTVCVGTTYTLDAGPGMASYLWSDNSTAQTLDVTVSGSYSVYVVDNNGCDNFDAVDVTFVVCPWSGPQAVTTDRFNIYPNPASSQFEIIMGAPVKEDVTISVYDALGNQVMIIEDRSGRFVSKTVDIAGLRPGIYSVEVKSANMKEFAKLIRM